MISLHKKIIYCSLCILLVGCQTSSLTHSENSLSETPTQTASHPSKTPSVLSTEHIPSVESTILPTPSQISKIKLNYEEPDILPAPTFETDSPAARHGMLHIEDTMIMDQHNEIFQLRGLSSHGIQWYSQYLNPTIFQSLRDDYHINTLRLALYADTASAYPEHQESYTKILEDAIHTASNLGLYIIIDWHILEEGDPLIHEEDATAFFYYFSKKYQNYPNIIFELCNEPNGNQVSWGNQIKPYAEALLKVIRGNNCSQLVIVGTPHWCQSPLSVVRNRLEDSNVLYAFHFYASTHGTPLRDHLNTALTLHHLPVIVSEFGTCEATGSGLMNIEQCDKWLNLLDKNHISWLNWSLCDKDETSAFLLPDTPDDLPIAKESLTESGQYIANRLLSYKN